MHRRVVGRRVGLGQIARPGRRQENLFSEVKVRERSLNGIRIGVQEGLHGGRPAS